MKPLVPDAGRFARIIRGAALCAGALLAGASVAEAPRDARSEGSAEARYVIPQGFIAGGFAAPPAVVPGQVATGAFIKLIFPAAIAVNGPDLYVADSGQRRLLRIDTLSRAVSGLRELPALTGVRLETDRDGSVYVLEPGRQDVERIARDGRRIALYAAKFDILQPADIVVGPRGRLWISDTAGGVFAFHPSGRVGEPLAGRGDGFADEFSGATLLAAGPDGVVGIHPQCRCAIVFDRNDVPIAHFGADELVNPVDLAVDSNGRTWIADRGDQRLKIFDRGQLVASLLPARMGVTEITALSIDAALLYLSDGPGGKIAIFSILPPAR